MLPSGYRSIESGLTIRLSAGLMLREIERLSPSGALRNA
jgi:hypothetical protein